MKTNSFLDKEMSDAIQQLSIPHPSATLSYHEQKIAPNR